jgi:hypothetical protein
MHAMDLVTSVDRWLVEAAAGPRSAPLTAVMTLLSAWWVKGLLIAGIGTAADLRTRPRRLPATPLIAGVAAQLQRQIGGCDDPDSEQAAELRLALCELFRLASTP